MSRRTSLAILLLAALPAGAQPRAPSWIEGSTCYEVFVRSFQDSDGDGVGDLRGLTRRLDYINDGNPRTTRDLGARCLWLMPIAESPSYHGYDVADWYRVDREYGTNDDFKRLVAAAHRRGIRVLVDMVLNHVSSEHPWFQFALRDSGSAYRAWFRFVNAPGPANRWGGNNWHKSPLRDEWYYGFFWRGMPDLNYATPAVLAEMQRVATFWLREMGADGFRLDAVKYLVEDGAQVEDTPGTHRVLRDYAAHVRRVKPGVFTVGEVYDSTGALLPYYPDQLDAYFAFEVADSIITAVRTGNARGMLAPVLRLQAAIPSWRWAPFLRNHDQPRTMTELGSDPARARLAATLLLALPGTPFVYYGEELGMTGAKPDERIRTPMAWTRDGPHAGFTRGTPWEPLQPDSASANVAVQDGDPASLLTLYRRLIHLRASHPGLARGTLVPLATRDSSVVAWLRRAGARVAIVIANLGDAPVQDLTITSEGAVLPAGVRRAQDLLGRVPIAPLTIGVSGAIDAWVPVPRLGAREALVLDLRAPLRAARGR